MGGLGWDPRARGQEAAEALQGSCRDLSDELTEEEAGEAEVTDAIDELVFLCDQCGWWYETCSEDEATPGVCVDCVWNG